MSKMKTTDNYWFEIWFSDKNSMIELMNRNMNSDIEAGYDINGSSITKQKEVIDEYTKTFNAQIENFVNMDDAKRNRWCYYDIIKRGVITPIC